MATQSFQYTGGFAQFIVPALVTSIRVTATGGGSGSSKGGYVRGTLAVNPGQQLWIHCGGVGLANAGNNGGSATVGGGGAGGIGHDHQGGDSGGGCTVIRIDSATGKVKAVAGGAGGKSGDDGKGGEGGADTGQSGDRATFVGPDHTVRATGGTQTSGGKGGTTSFGGNNYWGADSESQVKGGIDKLQPGGKGGGADVPSGSDSFGGGGGGGGYFGGGGGNAGSPDNIPGGGGAGGSNYVGGLTNATSERGGGTAGGGSVDLLWSAGGPPVNHAPSAPTAVTVNGVDATSDMATDASGTVVIEAELNDPEGNDFVRMLARISADNKFTSFTDAYSHYTFTGGPRMSVTFTGLAQNTHFFVRLYAQDDSNAGDGLFSSHIDPVTGAVVLDFNSIDFWTNRPPDLPELTAPAENAAIPVNLPTGFDWNFTDPDAQPQGGWELRYRVAPTSTQPVGQYVVLAATNDPVESHTTPPGTFLAGRGYEWEVRVNDGFLWSDWSLPRSFYALGTTTPPVPIAPTFDSAVDVSLPTTLVWLFVDHEPGDVQVRADVRWRIVGQDDSDWITTFGAADPGVPGSGGTWEFPAGTFVQGLHYEWQARTLDTTSALLSEWSTSATFWTINAPGSASVEFPVIPFPTVQGSLGCGTYRVFVYDQGGRTPRGEIKPLTTLTFSRKRDDISDALLVTNGFGEDCCQLFENLRCWAHEIVIFRDGMRVWEGPITRIEYRTDSVEIEAKDVLAYLYRRIMRQGFNDSFQMVDPTTGLPVTENGLQLGLRTVVDRATLITVNALAPFDPNLLPYLTALNFPDDARQSRIVPDYTKTAWEEIDDLAAHAGLDYTVIGRRIIYWDTHRAIGRLPEMRDGDFDSPPIVSEYGMQMSNYSAVTNGAGIWGAATPKGLVDPFIYFGPVETLNTAFNESSAATDAALTPAARAALVAVLEEQAARNINHRWPSPVVVRVPDNSTLNPNVAVTFDQLVPGVWIPLRSTGTCRAVSQWQKLDSVTVTETEAGERVQVVMSPAPNGGEDPDSDNAVEVTPV